MLQVSAQYPRMLVKTTKRYRELINTWNGKKNLYRSVYHFDYLKNGKPDFSDIIINQIFIEFDNDNSHEITKAFAQKLHSDKLKFRISFSGRRGYHIYISTEHKNVDRKSYLILLYKYILDKYNLTKDIDSHIVGNIKQMRRIENTLNIRSDLYCIPITYREMQYLTFDEIKELAQKPRNFDVCWIDGGAIKLNNVNICDNINEYHIVGGNGEFKEIDNVLPEPCEARILNLRHPSHEERFLLCLWLSWVFRGGTDINDFNLIELKERIIAFMKTRNWDDYSEELNIAKSTRYQVDNIINKRYNWVPNCKWRRMYGICNSEYCWELKHKYK